MQGGFNHLVDRARLRSKRGYGNSGLSEKQYRNRGIMWMTIAVMYWILMFLGYYYYG